jgi:hypothetical protein
MVLVAVAAVSGAAYGAYRGGQAAVNKTKECLREGIRNNRRKRQKAELDDKTKGRKERIARLNSMREASLKK